MSGPSESIDHNTAGLFGWIKHNFGRLDMYYYGALRSLEAAEWEAEQGSPAVAAGTVENTNQLLDELQNQVAVTKKALMLAIEVLKKGARK